MDDEFIEEQAERMRYQIENLLAMPAFQESVREIRDELGICANADQEYSVELQLKMQKPINSLRKEFNLDTRFETFLMRYIVWGTEDSFEFGHQFAGHIDEVTGKQIVSNPVYAESRLEDVVAAYQLITEYYRNEAMTAGYFGPRLEPHTNIERDKIWFEWREEGMSYRNIAARWATEKNEPEPHHTTVKRAIEKYKKKIVRQDN